MPKELIYLLCGEARDKSSFIRHVHNLVHIQLKGKETYDDLFAALEAEFKDQPENLAAAKEWIQFITNETDPESLKLEVLEVIPDPGIKMYAIFDLVPVKE